MNRQKGFTLLELLVALAISSTILILTLQIYINLLVDNGRIVNRTTAISSLDQTLAYITQDLMQTQEISSTQNSTTLRWTDFTGNQTDHVVIYDLSSPGSKILRRKYDTDPIQIVGRNVSFPIITPDVTPNFTTITVSITSFGVKSPTVTKTLQVRIKRRGEFEE